MSKVFISYTHDSPAHSGAVLDLADRLRADGMEATLDQYVTAPPEGWRRWMQHQITAADFVLMVCTEAYSNRAEGREKPGVGHGAAYEAGQILQDLYDAGGFNTKFIPVLLQESDLQHIPRDVRPYTHYKLFKPDGYDALYRHLTGQPAIVAPAIGSVKVMPPRTRGGGGNPP